MINRLSNPINRNRSAAKISKVMSSIDHSAPPSSRDPAWSGSRGWVWIGVPPPTWTSYPCLRELESLLQLPSRSQAKQCQRNQESWHRKPTENIQLEKNWCKVTRRMFTHHRCAPPVVLFSDRCKQCRIVFQPSTWRPCLLTLESCRMTPHDTFSLILSSSSEISSSSLSPNQRLYCRLAYRHRKASFH